MKRIYFILNLIILGVLTFVTGNDDIEVKVNIPDSIEAGKSFMVELTFIKKTKIETFARFISILPNGMTAEPYKTQNAIFSFKDKEVKFLWLPGSLPKSDTFNISFTIHVDTTVSGNVFIQSQFVYIKENERKTLNLKPISIKVINNYGVLAENYNPGDTVILEQKSQYSEQNNNININDYINHPEEGITRIIRINGNTANVTVIVNKKDVGGSFAKIEEKLPPVFEAIAKQDGGGVYTFTNHTAKFLWVNFPKDSTMIVKYQVMKNDASNITPDELKIKGVFSYLNGTKTIELPIKNIGQQNKGENILATNEETNNSNKIEQNPENKKEISNVSNNKSITSGNNNEKKPQETNTENLKPISFRVQICALSKKHRTISYVKRLYHIRKKLYLEQHEGWRKYTAGNFKTYKSARNYRNYLWNKTPATDAFVSAYNNGERITVQEALMITNQRWIK